MPPLALTMFRVFLLLASFPGIEKHVVRLVKGALDWWSGKKIAVIGPTASGKDSFLARLQNQEIPQVHSNSPMGEKVKSFRVKLALSNHQVIDITCKGVINIGGETDYRDAPSGWLAVCKDADVVFYIMTIKDLSAKTVPQRPANSTRSRLAPDRTATPQAGRAHSHLDQQDRRGDRESYRLSELWPRSWQRSSRALDRTVKNVLHPYEARYTGATLISMKNKQIYTRAINDVLRSVYSAFHGTVKRKKAG